MAMPPGHAEGVATRPALTGRERWMIRGVLGVVAVLAVVLVVSLATAGKSSARGCIYATIPGPVGAEQIDECGARARETCRTAAAPGEFTPEAAQVVERECRKAGLQVGG